MSGPQTVWALWSACDAAGGRRSSVQRDTRGYPVGILSALVTICPERVGPRGSLREQVAEAHRGSDPGTRCEGAVAGWARWCSHVRIHGHAANRCAGIRGQRASAGGPPQCGRPCSTIACALTWRSSPTGTGRALPSIVIFETRPSYERSIRCQRCFRNESWTPCVPTWRAANYLSVGHIVSV